MGVAVTDGFLAAADLDVVMVSSWEVRAWIWRWTAAGLMSSYCLVRAVLDFLVTFAWCCARWLGVAAMSYFLLTWHRDGPWRPVSVAG